jgi:hypothetical protein
MKMYGGVQVNPHAFLTSVLDGGEWSSSYLGHFAPRVRPHSIHWIGGSMVKKKALPLQGIKTQSSSN